MNKTRTRAKAKQSKHKGRINRKDDITEDGTRALEHDKENKTRKIENEEEY